jgi:hypothetical protein
MANAQGMLPPQNIEAEQSVLGSLLIDRDAIIKVAQFLKPEDFYREAHRIIYAAALDLFERKEPTDFVTLSDELRRRGKLEEVGGAAYLTALINAVPTAVHVEYYGRIVERCALLRRLIHAAGEIAALAYQEQDADVAIDRSEQLLYQLVQRHRAQEFVPIREVLKDYFDQIDWIHQHRGTVIGVPTGFRALDELTGGLQRSDLIIVAGRPSMGKTAFVLNIARNAAVEHHVPTAIFSLEMSREQLVQRLLCIQAHIDLHQGTARLIQLLGGQQRAAAGAEVERPLDLMALQHIQQRTAEVKRTLRQLDGYLPRKQRAHLLGKCRIVHAQHRALHEGRGKGKLKQVKDRCLAGPGKHLLRLTLAPASRQNHQGNRRIILRTLVRKQRVGAGLYRRGRRCCRKRLVHPRLPNLGHEQAVAALGPAIHHIKALRARVQEHEKAVA